MLTEKRTSQLVALCSELIQIESTSGDEKKIVGHLENHFRNTGCQDITIDRFGSITARFRGTGPGKTLLFDSHIDTVPVSDPGQWQQKPFGGEVKGDRIFGRGASDMKGALAAIITAMDCFIEDTEHSFSGTLAVSGVVHEESFEGVASRSISDLVKPDVVIIGEATGLNLARGQRGRAEIVIETFGRQAHSANPTAGHNAVYTMMDLVTAIRALPVNRHPDLGDGILELTDIVSSPYPGLSVVPDYCKATFDRRLLVGETKESVIWPIQELINTLYDQDSNVNARVSYAMGKESCYTGTEIEAERFYPGWLFDEGEAFIQTAVRGLKTAGLDPRITTYSFCTNGSHYAGENGFHTIGFGPSIETQAHVTDEYIDISQLMGACRGYYGIMKALLTPDT